MADNPSKSNRPKARLPRGLLDRGPVEIAATRRMIETIRAVYERYGFEPVETPAIEFTDALGKFLPDQDRPNEGVFSFQDDDEQWLSLRYDLTAPLARYVAENFDTLPKPYRSYRVGQVFRNEKPGPGRFRQFTQFDADTVGSASPAADAEMCMMAADAMEALGIPRGSYVVKVSNRKVLDGLLESLRLGGGENDAVRLSILRAIDKLDRLGPAAVFHLLTKGRKDESGDFTRGAGLSLPQADNVMRYLGFSASVNLGFPEYRRDAIERPNPEKDEAIGWLESRVELGPTGQEGMKELREIALLTGASGYLDGRILIDPSVVRGLEYYTGPVYEVELSLESKDEEGRPARFGSVGGGGRYDGLVARFRGEPVPATGFSIGVSRLLAALQHLGKVDTKPEPGPVVVTVFDRARLADYQRMVRALRDAGIRAEFYLGNPRNMGNQFKYADRRRSPCAVIQGTDEKQKGEVQIKDLIVGAELAGLSKEREDYLKKQAEAQFAVPEDRLVEAVREVLARHGVEWDQVDATYADTPDEKASVQEKSAHAAPPLADKLDLELAWRRVKADFKIERPFVDYPLELQLVDSARERWLDRVRAKLAAGYRPQSAVVTDIPKGNGGVRPGTLLTLEDQVVYAAAIGAILPSVNSGLHWSQGRVDFSNRLSEAPRRVEWFTSRFLSWSNFRTESIKRTNESGHFVVLSDITGFYENIDLTTLLSDLRALGCDNGVIQLLETCLNRWCAIPNRGIPQGFSPSDVLAKIYLNPVDQAVVDFNINYIRYVDDIRIFCEEKSSCKSSLMFIAQALRRRGLNLQSAKTRILSGTHARKIFEGATPIIDEVHQKYKESLIAQIGHINPYMTISEIEESVGSDETPIEVVREVFRLNFIETSEFDKTLFHYLLNRLAAQDDKYALEYCLGQFAVNPQETHDVLKYAEKVKAFDATFSAIESFLDSSENIYDYQIYQIFRWLNSLGVPPSVALVAKARRLTFENARPAYLRAECRIVLQNHGTTADLERLEASYSAMRDELEKAQLLVSLKRLEPGRRNALYGRVIGDGLLCEQAVTLVKQQRL